MGLIFEWDSKKAVQNLKKHHISFEEATTVFRDVLSITIHDPVHSVNEQRFVILGQSVRGRLLVVVHTDRGDLIRIISAREPTRYERKNYEEKS